MNKSFIRIISALVIFTLSIAPVLTGTAGAFSTDTLLENAPASFLGEDNADESATSIATVGDVNGDGYDDFLIGAHQNGVGAQGQVYLFFGKASGWAADTDLASADASFIGESFNAFAGFSVAAAGNVNGDGYDDILIGAYGDDGEGIGVNTGQTYLILGKESGWTPDTNLSTANASFIGEAAGDESGYSVCSAGDVNNDGFDDILIGARKSDGAGNDRGQTYLILGKDTGWAHDTSLAGADASFIGEADSDESGSCVSPAGDVNNDNYDDFLIGASKNDEVAVDAGQTYLILGRNTDWFMDLSIVTANATFIGEVAGDESGNAVACAGDINGDGYDDFLIGASLNDESGVDAGQVYLIYGKETSWSKLTSLSTVNASFKGENTGDQAGYAVASAGDIDGDGGAEILIGAPKYDDTGTNEGKTYLFFGNSFPNAPTDPQCEAMTNPVGVRDATPEFSWNFSDDDTGESQSAYRILVASTSANLTADTGDLWDSGMVTSISSASISYDGSSLGTTWGKTYYWKVKTWDSSDAEGGYCAEQTFTMQVAPNAPIEPKCEGLANPTALLDLSPEFTWKFSDADNPDNQSAYQILVASTSEILAANNGDVWDSGKVTSVAGGASLPETIVLKRGATYYWKVKTWDNLGAQGPHCAEQTFTLKSFFLPFWAEILVSAVGAAAIGSGIMWFLMRRKLGHIG